MYRIWIKCEYCGIQEIRASWQSLIRCHVCGSKVKEITDKPIPDPYGYEPKPKKPKE